MPRKPFGAGLPRWASGKACPAKATLTTTLWRRTFSAASSANWFTCAGMTPAGLLKRIFLPISRPFTIRCTRILPLAGSHRALLNCGCVMPLSPDLRDFTYYCDSFRFSALFTVYFFGKGSMAALMRLMDTVSRLDSQTSDMTAWSSTAHRHSRRHRSARLQRQPTSSSRLSWTFTPLMACASWSVSCGRFRRLPRYISRAR